MNVKRTIAAVTLAGTGLAGGLWLAPHLAGAQEDQSDEQTQEQPGEDGPCRGHRGPRLDAAAEAIGIEVDELRDALESGQTIAQVAEDNGVDVQTVVDAMVAAANEHLDEAVADGRLTQEEADEKKAELPDRITALVNGERPERPDRPEGRDSDEPDAS